MFQFFTLFQVVFGCVQSLKFCKVSLVVYVSSCCFTFFIVHNLEQCKGRFSAAIVNFNFVSPCFMKFQVVQIV